MPLRMYGQYIIQDDTPGESPVMEGTLWYDTLNDELNVCTSVAPYVFTQVGGGGGVGTVTSVALSVPSLLSVSGSPITTAGTFAVTWNAPANRVPYFSALNTLATSANLTYDGTTFTVLGPYVGNVTSTATGSLGFTGQGQTIDVLYNPTGNVATGRYASFVSAYTDAANVRSFIGIRGHSVDAGHMGSGNITHFYASSGIVSNFGSGNILEEMAGFSAESVHEGTGTVGLVVGGEFGMTSYSANASAVGDMVGVYVPFLANSGTGGVARGRSFWAKTPVNDGGGTFPSFQHIYLESTGGVGSVTSQAINYADLFIVNSSGSVTTPSVNKITITAPATGATLTIPDGTTINTGVGGTLGSNAFTSTAYLPLAGGTLTGNLLFTDNTLDIGASGATRPRTGYFGTSLIQGGALNLVTTPTDGVVLQNTTAATGGVPVQISPRVLWSSTAWDTDDSVSRTVRFFVEVLPGSGATPSGTWKLGYIHSVTSAITYPLTVSSTGGVQATASIASSTSGVRKSMIDNGSDWATGFATINSGLVAWMSGTTAGTSTDTVLSRNAAGVVQVGTSTTPNASGSMLMTNCTATGTINAASSAVVLDTNGVTMGDAKNVILNTTTGTKIGTSTSQKLGFYNATPIVQGASVADASGGAVIDAEARTAINALISRIEATGLIATV